MFKNKWFNSLKWPKTQLVKGKFLFCVIVVAMVVLVTEVSLMMFTVRFPSKVTYLYNLHSYYTHIVLTLQNSGKLTSSR